MIRVGLVGYGLGGKIFHAPLIRACRRMVLAAVMTSRELPGAVGTLAELIDRSDLVVVSTPNESHFTIAQAALEAGKHVVVDKPFTVSLDEADALIVLAAARQRVLTVFHNRRWDGDFLAVRKVMPRLGAVRLAEMHWDRFRPAIKPGWREVSAVGAGLLNDLGPHMIDQMLLPWNAAVPARGLDGIHIFFPDPWHKKRHNKRRLLQTALVARLAARLKPGGYLHCATDWQPYADQMLLVLGNQPMLHNRAAAAHPERNGFAPKPDYRPLTKFEKRGLGLGHGVWDLVFHRI